MSKEENIRQNGRLVMVNPNSVNGEINGKPLTPPYEDMCISVNLEVEVVHRTKKGNAGGNGISFNESTFIMSWNSSFQTDDNGKVGLDNKKNYVSFMEGEDAEIYGSGLEGKKYLTTYYTDISLNDIREKNIVEGLGISNVSISYDNMYQPTIVIKFIDVRGSSVFGREEAVHKGNDITSETIFGCFFTLPYPKFRIQVKGFYGDAVTYQLACTGFKGNFNSQTGNFEITTTFIGYQYSLLTDIPFAYLVAAPYCEYVGKEYWNEKKKTDEWSVSGSKGEKCQMMTLWDIYTKLKRNLKGSVSNADALGYIDTSNKQSALNEIDNLWGGILDEFGKCGEWYNREDCDNYDGHVTVLLFTCNNQEGINDSRQTINEKVTTLKETLADFNENHPDSKIELTFNNEKWACVENIGCSSDKKYWFRNDNIWLNTKLRDKFKKEVEEKIKAEDTDWLNKRRFGFCITDGGFVWGLKEAKTKYNNEVMEERQKNPNYVPAEITSAITFKPSIGNFFKIIIAHLETLCEMVYHCSSTIVEQMGQTRGRDTTTLNVNVKDTDAYGELRIPPFPAVYRREPNNGNDNPLHALGWCGDFSHMFEEESLITSLYSAMQHTSIEKMGLAQQVVDVTKIIPSMPLDLYIDNSSTGKGNMTIDLVGMLVGLRMAQIFGVLNGGKHVTEELAKIHGQIDALNFLQSIKDKEKIKELLFKQEKDGQWTSLQDVVKGIIECNGAVKREFATSNKLTDTNTFEFEHHKYENMPNAEEYNNHPIHVTDKQTNEKSNYTYTYIWGGDENNTYAIVPVVAQNQSAIFGSGNMVAYESGKRASDHNIPLHNPVVKNSGQLLYTVSTTKFINSDTRADYIDYTNEAMFNIITDTSTIKSIRHRYNDLLTDSVNVEGYSFSDVNVKKILQRYFDMDISQYFDENMTQYLAKSKKEGNINTTSRQFDLAESYSTKEDLNKNLTFIDPKTAFDSVDLSEYFVPYLLCDCSDQDGGNIETVSLDITRAFSNGYTRTSALKTSELMALKCFMLLHAIPLNWSKITKSIFNSGEHGYVKRVPYAVILFMGAHAYFIKKFSEYYVETTSDEANWYVIPNKYRKMWFSDDKGVYKGICCCWHGAVFHNWLKNGKTFQIWHSSNNVYDWSSKNKQQRVDGTFDYIVSNKLIEEFTYWIQNDGKTIVEELIKSTGKTSWASHKAMMNHYKIKAPQRRSQKEYDVSGIYWWVLNLDKLKSASDAMPNKIDLNNLKSNNHYFSFYNHTTPDAPINSWCMNNFKSGFPMSLTKDLINKNGPYDRNDAHWTAIYNNNSLIAYFKSNAPFMKKLVELFTKDCLIFCNCEPNKIGRKTIIDFVYKKKQK